MTPAPSANSSPPATEADADGLRVGFLPIGRKRPGFDQQWAAEIDRAVREAIATWPLVPILAQTHVVDDGSLRQAIAELRQAECDTIVVMQPAMGDGRLAPILAQLWNAPLVLWATPERPNCDRVSSCSLVGTHVFATTLRQLGRPFELALGHPREDETKRRVMEAVRLTAAAARLRRSKVGLVGYHAPGFVNMHADPISLEQGLGVQLTHFGLREFLLLMDGLSAESLDRDVAAASELQLPFADDTGPDDLVANSRYYLAMQQLLAEEGLDALALRCWPELPNQVGAWPYLAMARLANENRAIALEGDVDGAICSLIGRLLGLGVGYLSDWIAHDDAAITLWHPGHACFAMCDPESLRLGRHFNSGHPLVVNARLAADRPLTLMRLWRCDGRYRMTACHARTAAVEDQLMGATGRAVLEDRSPDVWFDNLCHEGMPHHLLLLAGCHRELLRRFARQMGIQWIEGI